MLKLRSSLLVLATALLATLAPAASAGSPRWSTLSRWSGSPPVFDVGGVGYTSLSVEGYGDVLVRTTGTAASTGLVRTPVGDEVQAPGDFTPALGTLFFRTPVENSLTRHTLWRIDDGAAVAAGELPEVITEQGLVGAPDALYWEDATRIYRVDPRHGTRELFSHGGSPTRIAAAVPGRAYVVVGDPAAQRRLVAVTPKGEATVLSDHYGGQAVVSGSSLYFLARDDDHGLEPWVTDGTPAGTKLVADTVPGAASVPDDTRLIGDDRLVVAEIPVGPPSGEPRTERVLRLTPDAATPITTPDGRPFTTLETFTTAGSTTYLEEGHPDQQFTPGTTHRVVGAGATLGPAHALRAEGTPFGTGGALFYGRALPPGGLGEIVRWSGEGEPAVLAKVEREPEFRGQSHPPAMQFSAASGLVWFSAYQDGFRRLWRSDGTSQGTFPIIPAVRKTEITLWEADDYGSPPDVFGGFVAFPGNARARCTRTIAIVVRRRGKVTSRIQVPLRWTGTGCVFRQAVKRSTFARRGNYTVRATLGSGPRQLTSRSFPVSTS